MRLKLSFSVIVPEGTPEHEVLEFFQRKLLSNVGPTASDFLVGSVRVEDDEETQ